MAHENVSAMLIQSLRDCGHDVLSVKESLRGANDAAILAQAQAERRLVLTHDKDFGELAFRFGLPAQCGVILLRLTGDNPDIDQERALRAVQSRTDWEGRFSVIEDERMRMRSLPGASGLQSES